MALISPGLQLSVTDESQYVPGAVGSTPLVVLATAQDKTANGSYASGTSKANAGKLQVFTSQRELVSALGYPTFKQSAAGTPLHGSALNEYGLMAAYSTLAIANRVYAIRADIDLNELEPTTSRPLADPENGTVWLDLAETSFGINEWDNSSKTFTEKEPILITDLDNDTVTFGSGSSARFAPKTLIGSVGDYAVVLSPRDTYYYYKSRNGLWRWLDSELWKIDSHPTVVGRTPGTLVAGDSVIINGEEIFFTEPEPGVAPTIDSVVADIAVSFPYVPGSVPAAGVRVAAIDGKIVLFASASAESGNEPDVSDGILKLQVGTDGNPGLTALGLDAGDYHCPEVYPGSYVDAPNWFASERPTGSVYLKTSAIGGGMNFAIKKFNAESSSWTRLAMQTFPSEQAALYGFDPITGGFNLPVGTIFAQYSGRTRSVGDQGDVGVTLNFMYRRVEGATTLSRIGEGKDGGTFIIRATQSGTDVLTEKTITLSGPYSTVDDYKIAFVTELARADVPEITARYNSSTGEVTLAHVSGGTIFLEQLPGQGTPISDLGFTVASLRNNSSELIISNFTHISEVGMRYDISLDEPYTSPEDNTHWYFGDPTQVDVMINDGTAWRGYRTVTQDARGYDLRDTDPAGPIISPTKPRYQSNGVSQLKPGDLWLDTSDLENFPKFYRYNTLNKWIPIDNTDRTSQNGIIFADARWDTDGTTDSVVGSMPKTVEMLTSDYVDLDCPNPRLYPRGTLLFNTRRSGFNVKKFVNDYFNEDSFPGEELPDVTSTWVSVSGLRDDGSPYMGAQAQRNMVVKAMRSALDGNTQVREDQFFFNLVTVPGYPELITNMVALNNDRKNTAFVIGDTPMTLPTDSIAVANWANNVNGDGLSTADPYLGIFYPAGLTNDVDGNTIVVPASHMMLRTFIRNDNVSYPWFAPAGTRRGLIDNATDIGYINPVTGGFVRNGINQGMRDALYENRVNPLTILPGVGLVAFGQKTRNPTASAMDRVNVARLVNYIRTILASVGNGFLFEPNDKITRDQIKSIIEGAMNDLVAKRGIYDYLVVCDSSNNTPTRIARNELYVDIAIEPMKAVEFIYIPIRLKNPGDIAKLGG